MSKFLITLRDGAIKLTDADTVRSILERRPEAKAYLIKETKAGLTLKPVSQSGKVLQKRVSEPELVADGVRLEEL